MPTEATVEITVNLDEAGALLDLIGHDGNTFEEYPVQSMVFSLYRIVELLSTAKESSAPLVLNERQLYLMHRYFSPSQFGQTGRQFRVKIADALVALERQEDMPELPAAQEFPAEPNKTVLMSKLKQFEENNHG